MATLTLQPAAAAGIDTAILAGTPNGNLGVSQLIAVGLDFPGLAKERVLLKFDLSALPAGAIVSAATLTLTAGGVGSASPFDVSVHRSLVQWYEGDGNYGAPSGDGSTWNYRNHSGSVAWSGGAGGGSASDYAASATDTESVTGLGAYAWDVTADVSDWAAGSATNHGWFVIGAEASSGSEKAFNSSDGVTAADRPKLAIVYQLISEGAAAGSGTASGKLIAQMDIAGAAAGTVALYGSLVSQYTSGSAAGTSTQSGHLTGIGAIEGTAAGTSEVTNGYSGIEGLSAGTSVVTATGDLVHLIRGHAVGVGIAAGTVWGDYTAAGRKRNSAPLLYITDGTVAENGQLNRLDLLNCKAGYMLDEWSPAVAQYKGGGYWSDSPLGAGRMLTMRRFENAIEVLDLKARAPNQNQLAAYVDELLSWQEAAADYWTSRWGARPVYLAARAADESHTRFALVHAMSVAQLKNPYAQPFAARGGSPLMSLTLRVERGHWRDQPPGQTSCVAIGNAATWKFTQWEEAPAAHTGVGLTMIEAANGDILLGTDNAGKIYHTSDAQIWTVLSTIGGGAGDAVNALAKDAAGNLYAAVSGSTSAGGLWKSSTNGASWARVVGGGAEDWQFYDVGYNAVSGVVQAVGWAINTAQPPFTLRAAAWADSEDGNIWATRVTTYFYYKAVGVAFDRSWPNALMHYDPGGASGNSWVWYAATDRLSQGIGTLMGPYAYGGYDLIGWPSATTEDLNGQPVPGNVIAALKTPSAGTHTLFNKLFLATLPYYAAIGQVLNDAVLALYADPSTSNSAKSIYGGGDGVIYVSRNGGYTWATLTTAPATAIRSFLRTSAGALLAAGDGEVFLLEGSGVSDLATESLETTVGRAATCDNAVYAANQGASSNLTHVKVFDASVGSYTDHFPAATLPFNLLPALPAANDILFIGAENDLPDTAAGPFANVVFDLGEAARDVTIVWEYWNGSSWGTLAVEDRTQGFRATGPVSVAWLYPANWTEYTVDGVQGYWVRARVSAVGSSPAAPAQDVQDVYSARAAYVEIAGDDVGGTLPAAMRLRWLNIGDDAAGGTPDLEIDRLAVGLRSVSRGANFNAYLSAGDKQSPFGVTVSVTSPFAFDDTAYYGTARAASLAAGAGGYGAWKDAVTWTLATTVARDYYGAFRAFLRVSKGAGDADDLRFRLRLNFGSGGVAVYSQATYSVTTGVWEVIDLGRLDIPNQAVAALGEENLGDELAITAQAYVANATPAVAVYDLVLIPVDEWAADGLIPALNTTDASQVDGDSYLELDSTANPKAPIVALNRTAGGLIQARYQTIANGPAILQTQATQRLWFLAMTYVTGPYWRSYPEIMGQVTVRKVQHYLGLRGDR